MGDVTMTHCPCCGSSIQVDRPIVDLDSNTITFGELRARVRPKVAEFVHVLSAKWPGAVRRSAIIADVWGGVEPPNSENCVRLLAYQSRQAMAGWPFTVTGSQSRGFRLLAR